MTKNTPPATQYRCDRCAAIVACADRARHDDGECYSIPIPLGTFTVAVSGLDYHHLTTAIDLALCELAVEIGSHRTVIEADDGEGPWATYHAERVARLESVKARLRGSRTALTLSPTTS